MLSVLCRILFPGPFYDLRFGPGRSSETLQHLHITQILVTLAPKVSEVKRVFAYIFRIYFNFYVKV